MVGDNGAPSGSHVVVPSSQTHTDLIVRTSCEPDSICGETLRRNTRDW